MTVLHLDPEFAPRPLASRPTLSPLVRVSLALVLVANLGRIPVLFVGSKDAPILVTDFGVAAVLIGTSWLALRYRTLAVDNVAGAALVFAAVGGLSALLAIPRFGLSGFEFVVSIAYLARWLLYFGLYLAVINFVRREEAGSVWRAFEAMVLVFAGFGILQSLFLPGFAQRVYPDSVLFVDWDPQGHRLVSTFLDPNFAGALIMMVLLVLLAWLAMGAEVSQWKIVLLFVALAMTVSRSSVIGLMAGTMLIFAVRGVSRRVLRTAAVLTVLALPLLPMLIRFAAEYGKFSVGQSALARVIMWGRALEILADNPIIGVGFNTYGFVQRNYGFEAIGIAGHTLDGGLLFVAVMTGLVGLAIYCTMLGFVFARCRRIWRDRDRVPHERGLALGIAAATIALVVHSVFLNSLFLPFLIGPLWVLWGLVFLLRSTPNAPAGAVAERRPLLVALPPARR